MPFPKVFPDPPYKRERHSYDCQGRLIVIREGLTVVPYQQVKGGWYAVVVEATTEQDKRSYPRGGYNILVFDKDVETAIERTMEPIVEENNDHRGGTRRLREDNPDQTASGSDSAPNRSKGGVEGC